MKYPIGIQDFATLREGGHVYVDKTDQIIGIINALKYAFLPRPRRFGKSLTVATIAELYGGRAELFTGLYAEQHWDFAARQRPVIWLQFASAGVRTVGTAAALGNVVADNAERLGISLPEGPTDRRFAALIRGAAALSPAGKVVLLIDEYDKPITEFLPDIAKAEANRDLLKGFYSVLKDADPYLEFVFITGITAFAKVSLFSDLNNVVNLSLHPLAHTIVGWTREELEATFAKQLDATGVPREEVQRWYNGYSWGSTERVYNPWAMLNFLLAGEVRDYWFDSGTPTFVTKLAFDERVYNLAGTKASIHELNNFDLRRLDPRVVLFQTGYLTIDSYNPAFRSYTLRYPNMEVRSALEKSLLAEYTGYAAPGPADRVEGVYDALLAGDLQRVIDGIDAAINAVPGEFWRGQTEFYYHAVVFLLFRLLGLAVSAEVSTARGRADAVVEMPTRVYVFEFKLGRPAAEALAQIEARGYARRYADDPREVVKVGVSFDAERRAVGEWLVA